jgi:membrane protein implicated in regulation of membrane protease activity
MTVLVVLAVMALAASVAWLVAAPSFEPAIAVITALSGLIALLIARRRKATGRGQHQNVSGRSVGIQAGRDVNIGSSPTRGKER